MPIGFVITEWTEDQGLAVLYTHPETLEVDLDDMMKIFLCPYHRSRSGR